MKLKKLKRLLSLTLSAVMVTSMVSVPVNAETVSDNPGIVQEESVDNEEDVNSEDAEGEEGVSGAEEEEQDIQDKADEPVEEQTPSSEDTEEAPEVPQEEEVKGARTADTKAKAARITDAQAEGDGNTDTGAGDGTADGGTTEGGDNTGGDTEVTNAIVVGDAAGQTSTLDEAVDIAAAGEVKTIQLEKDVTLTKNLDQVTIDTKGHMITIPAGTNVEFGSNTVIENKVLRENGNTMQKNHAAILAEGTLTIKGGTYQTKAVQLLKVTGSATVEGGTFACNATSEEVSSLNYYDGATLIDVEGTGAILTMTGGTVNANVGNSSNCGMYGIYIWNGGEVKLGAKGAAGPTVNSMFSAIAMNGIKSPGRITVESGKYTSSVSCTADSEKKFNSVMYLPASATVNISGGTFEATADNNNDLHVISIPYGSVDNSAVRLNLNITGGTFKRKGTGTVFYHPNKATASKVKVTVSGGDFSADISQDTELGSTSIPEGLACYAVAGNMYRVGEPAIASVGDAVFSNLQDAIAATATLGVDTIKLKGNVALEGSYNLNGVTIDTDGYLITVPAGKCLEFSKGTVKNTKVAAMADGKWTASHQMFEVLGELKIDGGTYQTKGVQMIRVSGTAEIGGGATLECNAESTEISSAGHYDGAALINVTGPGNLTVKEATIKANVGNGTDCGMYGIYVNLGGTVTLGEGAQVPKIDSMFAPVAMNGLNSPGKITINGGTYTSHVACTDEGIKKFNAVLYLPASADVTINDGTFTAAGTGGEQHVISVPYSSVSGNQVALNLVINGGTFRVTGGTEASAIFYDNKKDGDKLNITVRGGSFNKEPAHVAGCNPTTQDADGNWVITGTAEHKIKWVSQKASTCWEEGVIGHYECQECHKMYPTSTADDSAELKAEDVVILKKEHVGESHEAVTTDKPCTEPSNTAYVQCPNCKLCYDDLNALEADQDGKKGKQASEYITAPKGHDYFMPVSAGEEGQEGTELEEPKKEYAVTINADNFDAAGFKYGEANGVTAELACQQCDNKITADEVSVTIASGELNGKCSEEKKVTLKVDAVFKKDNFGAATTDKEQFKEVSKEKEITVSAKQHSFDAGSVTVNWDAFDIAAFQTGKTNGVTATGICKDCGESVTATAVAVTSADYPTDGTASCQVMYHFAADVTLGSDMGEGENLQQAPHVTVEKEFSGKHILVQKDTYLGATCMKPGHWATYECTECHNEYLGEDSAMENQPVASEDKVIAKRPHTINAPVFSWEKDANDKETDKAQAVFTCTACKNTVTLGSLTPVLQANSPKVECGKITTLTYDVTVEFDKTAVVENAEGDGLTYNPEAAVKKTSYSGTLSKTEAQPHMLENLAEANLEVMWADKTDSDTADTKHDVTKGVKVVATCGREGCGKKLTVLSVKNQIVDNESAILDDDPYIQPTVSLVLDKEAEGYQPASCKAEGTSVYNVTVKYRDEAGTVKTIGTKEITTKTAIDANAHQWSAPTWSWEQQKTDGVLQTVEINAKDADGKTIKCTVPKYKVTANYHCELDCGTADAPTEKTVEGTVGEAAEDSKEPHIEFEVTHTAGSCIKSSRTEYVAKIYDGQELVAASEPEVYIKASNGHQITVDWTWEDDAQANEGVPTRYTTVTAERYCTVCSKVENAPDQYGSKEISVTIPETIPETGIPSVTASNMTLAVTTAGRGATCTEAGTTNYTATLRERDYVDDEGATVTGETIAEDKKELSSKALGHQMRWFVEWQEQAGKTGSEKYLVTRTKKCQRTGCDQADSANPVTLELQYDSAPATCSAAGSETWTIKNSTLQDGEAYADEQADADGKLKAAYLTKEETLSIDPDAHDYGEAAVEWDETAAAAGADSITVTVTRTCSHAAGNTNHVPAETKTFTAAKQAGTDVTDCTQGYGWTYKVADADKAQVADWQMGAEWNEGVYAYTVENGTHDLRFVRGTTSSSCTAIVKPSYYVCDRCGKYYKDADCTIEYTEQDIQGKVQGHMYDEPTFSWKAGEEGEAAQAVFRCVRDGHTKTVDVTINKDVTAKGLEAQCEDTPRAPETVDGRVFANGEGYSWVQAAVDLTEEQVGIDTYLGGSSYENMLYQVLPAVPHEFVDGECKWCHMEGGITVEFYGRDLTTVIGRTYLSSKNLPADSADIELATPVNQLGYAFRGWSMTESGEASEDIRAEILEAAKQVTGTSGSIKVYPVYERDTAGIGSVEVQYVLKQGSAESAVKTPVQTELAIGSRYEAAASAEETVSSNTVYFSHWERDGVVVGTGLTYELYVQTASAITLKAVYVTDKKDAMAGKPAAAITDIYTTTLDGKNKISFSATMTVPEEGYELRETGLLYIKGTDINMLEENMKLETIGTTVDNVTLPHKKYVFSGSSSTKILTMQVTGMEDKKVYARPYVTVLNKETGNEETYYGSMKATTFNETDTQK